MDRARYIGVDLAWGQRNRTGLAVLDDVGRLVESSSVRTDAEIVTIVNQPGAFGAHCAWWRPAPRQLQMAAVVAGASRPTHRRCTLVSAGSAA